MDIAMPDNFPPEVAGNSGASGSTFVLSGCTSRRIVKSHSNATPFSRPKTTPFGWRKAALELGAGVLAMGGYGHSRLREFVLGGATRTVLAHPRLPVLLSH
jgi:hypothetical protein